MTNPTPFRILGCMTGTSCDGADLALLEITDAERFRVIAHGSFTFPSRLRESVLASQKSRFRMNWQTALLLERDLSVWYAKLFRAFTAQQLGGIPPDVIAPHGQTVAHFPYSKPYGLTHQIGSAAQIASLTGITTVSQFRTGDLTVGGRGAPLVPLYHAALYKNYIRQSSISPSTVGLHNLGGISNFTVINGKQTPGIVMGFDTGPANIWIDQAMNRFSRGKKNYDPEGTTARKGHPDLAAVQILLKLPYFRKPPPKATGRDDFPFSLLTTTTHARGADLVATATEFTARTIAHAYSKFVLNEHPLKSIYLCGGGAKNLYLQERLAVLMPEVSVNTVAQLGSDPQYVEAEAFAYLGYLALRGQSVGGSWTGAPTTLGSPAQIAPGKNWLTLMKRLART